MLSTTCACNKLRRSARILGGVYDEALAPLGLSVAQFSLLRMLERAGPCSLTEFGAATGYDRTTLNRTLAPLERAGLVACCCGDDKRTRIVEITPAARAVIRKGRPLWEEAQAKVDAALGGERDRLFGLLDRIEGLRA
ncbi:MAG TPA: MarR family transcriptional regulator [Allosphingosinicella sp.]|nr:MarR family transcriptional regulator [Allosphingosinicella sp.]